MDQTPSLTRSSIAPEANHQTGLNSRVNHVIYPPDSGGTSSTTKPTPPQLHISSNESKSHPSPPLSSHSSPGGSTQLPTDDDSPTTPVTPTPRRVHFRPRVRIASGLHHNKLTTSTSSSSSRSASPSSSISVPLRSPESDDPSYSPLWGPLGRRVSYFAWKRREKRSRAVAGYLETQQTQKRVTYGYHDERAPLVPSPKRSGLYFMGGDTQYEAYQDALDQACRLDREADGSFGTWPSRLLNHRWWWWHLEPVMCCSGDPTMY